jgi:hypothetical protein
MKSTQQNPNAHPLENYSFTMGMTIFLLLILAFFRTACGKKELEGGR